MQPDAASSRVRLILNTLGNISFDYFPRHEFLSVVISQNTLNIASVTVKRYILTEISITLLEDGYPMLSWLTTIVSVNNAALKNYKLYLWFLFFLEITYYF